MNSINSTDSIDSLDSTDSLNSLDSFAPEILACTHCGWFLTDADVQMIDDAIAEHGSAEKFQVANILCPKCLTRPVFAPLSEAKLSVIMAAGTRLNDTARRLYRKYNEACEAGHIARARDLYNRYRLFQTRLKAVLETAKEHSLEVKA